MPKVFKFFLLLIKMKKKIEKKIEVPDNVEVNIDGSKVKVKGPLGELERSFKLKENIYLKKENNKDVIIGCEKATKKEKKLINTTAAHIKNMIKGVVEGFEYKLQVCFSHFPISVEFDKEKGLLLIKNFLGENKERVAKILPDVDVEIKNDIVIVKGIDKEKVGQSAANIENATRIKAKDRRVYQDGIWIIEKAGKKV